MTTNPRTATAIGATWLATPRNRTTGFVKSLGVPTCCGLAGTLEGRAVTRPACSGLALPIAFQKKLDQALHLIDVADTSSGRRARKTTRHACTPQRQADGVIKASLETKGKTSRRARW